MRNSIRKVLALSFMISAVLVSAACAGEKQKSTGFAGVSLSETVKAMKLGWNLGNTLDAAQVENGKDYNAGLSSETSWGMPFTTQEMIKSVKAMGFSSIRIPCSWHNHIVNPADYTIDPAWMARVKQIVDWSLAEDLYVIINIHHDTAPNVMGAFGYYPDEKVKEKSKEFISRVWQQICKTFNNDYDHHLIFEVLNEPRARNTAHEWWCPSKWTCAECKKTTAIINEYNQLALDTIRASGGNNASRFVMIPSYVASPDAAFANTFKMPEDPAGNLILSVHMYQPYDFAMNVKQGSYKNFEQRSKNDLDYYFNTLNDKFVKKGYPVVIGEMGATNKKNLAAREQWINYFMKGAYSRGMACVIWDNGIEFNTREPNESFGQFNRTALKWYFPTMIEAGLKACQ